MYHYATKKFHNFTRYFGILLEDTHTVIQIMIMMNIWDIGHKIHQKWEKITRTKNQIWIWKM